MPIQRFLQRLVWACVLPVFVFAGALALEGIHHQYADDLQASERVSANLLGRIDTHVQARLDALQLLARTLPGTDPAAVGAHYREAQAFQGVFGSHVILADLERRMLYNTRTPLGAPLPELPVLRGPSAVQAALDSGQPAVGTRVFGPVAREPLVPLVVPVMREGRPVALLLTTLEVLELQALLDSAQLPPFMGLSLLDANGDALATRTPRASGATAGESEAGPTFDSNLTRWTLTSIRDRSILRGELVRTSLMLVAALAAAAAVVAWAARRAGRQLGRSVLSLAAEPGEQAGIAPRGSPEILEVSLARQRLQALAGERERAQAEVRKSDTRLRQLLGALGEAVWISLDHRIAFANPAAERLVGVTSEHMDGRTIFDFMQPDSAARAKPLLQRVRAGEPDVLFEDMRFADPDAPPRTLRVSGVTLSLPDGQATLTLARDITELYRARGALDRSQRDLGRLVERLNTVEEEERRRIARELHDDLQQRLGVIGMEQQLAARELPLAASASAAALDRAQAMTAQAIESVRRIVRSLRPQALDELGLAAALEVLVREWGQQGGVQAECEVVGPEGADAQLPPAVASCFYRVAQESLTNVRKHARASFVHVVLDLSHRGVAMLQVSDDGQGPHTAATPGIHAFGIHGMRERLQALGGQFVITTAPGGGTRVQARVAWPAA